MREKTVERALCDKVKERGGRCIKLTSEKGLPDRLVVLPGNKIAFIETKTRGGRLSAIQISTHARLKKIGCFIYVIWETKEIEGILNEIQTA